MYMKTVEMERMNKMNILIYGAGKYCKNLLEAIKKYPDIHLTGIADSNLCGEKFGYKILDLFNGDIIIAQDIVIVIAMANAFNACEIAKRLNVYGFYHIYLYLNKKKTFENDFLKGECISLCDLDDLTLPSVELHVTDFCNLNCRGCLHFSPLFEKKLPDFNIRIQDLYTLKKIFHKTVVIYLLGGEPLLNPELDRYIIETRSCFPEAEIQIVTNGLLLLKLDEKVFEELHKNKITIVISEYEPTHKIIEKIEKRLQEFRIDYAIREINIKERFNRPLSIIPNSKHRKTCISDGCTSVCDGRIARCPTLLYIDRFNEYFEQELPNQGVIELKNCTNGKELIRKLKEKVPLCNHCIEYEIDWDMCKTTISIEDFSSLD